MKSLSERIEERTSPEPNTGCWLWTGAVGDHGYGTISVNDTTRLAHRLAFEAAKGPIPSGLQIDHLCRQRMCVNPQHLEAVTHRENGIRGVGACAFNARKTHCVNGHEFTAENTCQRKDTRHVTRQCVACGKARRAAKMESKIDRQ